METTFDELIQKATAHIRDANDYLINALYVGTYGYDNVSKDWLLELQEIQK